MAKYSGKDTILRYNQILDSLKKKIYKPVYLLMGDEAYYIDKLSEYIANNVLDEAEKAFNQTIVYGRDVDNIGIIVDLARRFPMMSNYQVLIVREAQDIKKIEKLDVYVKNPLASTILVICYKGKVIDKRTSFYKNILKTGDALESVSLYESDIPNWISSEINQRGYEIEPVASALLSDFLGSDLNKIANEINKLTTVLPIGVKKITAADIHENIGISKDYNTFELSNAILRRDALKANKIAVYFASNTRDYPFVLTMATLFPQFVRLLKFHSMKNGGASNNEIFVELGINPYFLRDYENAAKKYNLVQTVNIISILREYDAKSKGFNYSEANDGELLRELVSKIINT